MTRRQGSGPVSGEIGLDESRAVCQGAQVFLGELVRIHLTIDEPTRRAGSDEPQWIFRLRKVHLHAASVNGWEIGPDVEHVMAPELRAAFEQMDSVWKELPAGYRFYEDKDGWWANEARNGMMATYDHPTPQSLLLSAGSGGFGQGEERQSYGRLAGWLADLAFGYVCGLVYLAKELGAEPGVMGRLTAAVRQFEADFGSRFEAPQDRPIG